MTPILTINGTPVKCALNRQAQPEPDPIGDAFARSFSGRARRSVRGYVRTFQLVTSVLSLEEAHGLMLALSSPYPLRCSGWLFGGLETECFGRVTAFHPRTYAHGDGGVVEFQLQDAGPYNPILFWLSASRALPATLSFSRNSPAWCTDQAGTPREADIDELRLHWLDRDGDGHFETPELLLEGARDNLMPEPATLAGYTITMSGDPAAITDLGSGIADGVAVVHFERTQEVGSDRRLIPPAACTIDTSQPHVFSVEWRQLGGNRVRVDWMFRGSAVNLYPDGQFNFLSRQESGAWQANGDCSILRQEMLADGWERIYVLVPPTVWDGTGDEVSPQATHRWTALGVWHYAWRRPQMEVGLVGTSFTDGTRAHDLLTADLTSALRGRTSFCVYLRQIERGTIVVRDWARALAIQSGSQFMHLWTPGSGTNVYEVWFAGFGASYGTRVGGTPQIGQQVEQFIRVDSGTVALEQSIDGAPVTTGSAVGRFGGFAGDVKLWIGSTVGGANHGYLGVRDVIVLRDARLWTMPQIRRLVG